jgi:lysylphosphatidylglycerol synthetase-like protein (DUF2156 family)
MRRKGFQMTKHPLSVIVCLVFILLNSLIWLVFGVIIAVNAHPAIPAQPLIKGIMAFLSIAIAVILLVLFVLIRRHNRIAYFLALAGFIVTSLLTIFDDFGLSDLVVLAINIVPIVLLIKDRAWYLQVQPQREGNPSAT